MKFSVIIPVYNVELYINKCIESVIKQDFDDYEIIAVDDGTKDNSGKILDELSTKHSQIRVIHQDNKGLGGARNTGIMNAKGKYIVLLDSDDYIHPNLLSTCNFYMEKYDLDIMAFDCTRVTEKEEVIDRVTVNKYQSEFSEISKKEFLLFEPTSCTKVYKRELFVKNDIFFPERLWYEDFATIYKLAPFANKIGYLKKSFYYYVQREGSITHSINKKRMLEITTAFDSEISFYKANNLFEKFYDELEWNCVLHVIYYSAFRLLINSYNKKEMFELYDYAKSQFPNLENNTYVQLFINEKYHMKLIMNKKYYLFYLKNGLIPKIKMRIKKFLKL